MPSGTLWLVPGEPVSTPAGMRAVSDALGGKRGGALVTGGGGLVAAPCACATAGASASSTAASVAPEATKGRITMSSWQRCTSVRPPAAKRVVARKAAKSVPKAG